MTKLMEAVKPHMEVIGSDGTHVGTVDHEDGPDRIKLTKDDGGHNYVTWDWVDRIEDGKLHLNVRAAQVQKAWSKIPESHMR